jgi:Sec-independent protein translocase protein TatA
MNFLGVGPFELLLILVIATIVLGPERMAQLGRSAGRLYAEYRTRWQRDVDEMTRELRRELESLQQEVEDIRQTAESEIQAAQSAFESVVGEMDLDALTGETSTETPSEEPTAEPVSTSPTSDQAQESAAGEEEETTSGGEITLGGFVEESDELPQPIEPVDQSRKIPLGEPVESAKDAQMDQDAVPDEGEAELRNDEPSAQAQEPIVNESAIDEVER